MLAVICLKNAENMLTPPPAQLSDRNINLISLAVLEAARALTLNDTAEALEGLLLVTKLLVTPPDATAN
jgi:hypothetical protein